VVTQARAGAGIQQQPAMPFERETRLERTEHITKKKTHFAELHEPGDTLRAAIEPIERILPLGCDLIA
jgi:hypothetical protein